MAKRMKPTPVCHPSSSVREHFRREIEQLLGEIPADQWADDEIRGVLYEFVPWHRMSSVTIQTRGDDPATSEPGSTTSRQSPTGH
jgi:hypothetical protein